MAGTAPLAEFVTLGQQLYVLMNPMNAQVIASEIPKFVNTLKTCGLQRTIAAASGLSQIESIPAVGGTPYVTPIASAQLKAFLDPIFRTLYSELGEQIAVVVNIGIVSQQLRELPSSKRLNPTQRDLLNETVTCIECGAYRAGAVFGWNLTYDCIRQWVFDNHLAAFNEKLTTQYLRKDGRSLFEPVVQYDDFMRGKPDERTVIDTCFMATLFGEKLRDNLRFYLRRRNDYAHPTFKSPSADQTNAYIKDLLDVLMARPFV